MVKSCFTSLVFHPKNSTCPFSCPGWSPSTSKCTEQFLATAAKWSAKVVRRLNSLFESNSSWWYGYSAPLYQHVHDLVPTQDETTWQPIKNMFVRREITTVDSWSAVGFFFGWLVDSHVLPGIKNSSCFRDINSRNGFPGSSGEPGMAFWPPFARFQVTRTRPLDAKNHRKDGNSKYWVIKSDLFFQKKSNVYFAKRFRWKSSALGKTMYYWFMNTCHLEPFSHQQSWFWQRFSWTNLC